MTDSPAERLRERAQAEIARARETHAYRNVADDDQPALFECDCGFATERHFEVWEHRDGVFSDAALAALAAHITEGLDEAVAVGAVYFGDDIDKCVRVILEQLDLLPSPEPGE